MSAAEPSKDPSAAASSGQLGISCKVLVGAKSAANSQRYTESFAQYVVAITCANCISGMKGGL